MSWMPKRAKFYVIRVYYKHGRGKWYVNLLSNGRRRVMKGWRGAERFERERDGLWVVITNRWQGQPIVERDDDADKLHRTP